MRLIVALLSCLCVVEWSQALADPPPESSTSQAAAPSAAPAASQTAPAATTALAAPGAASASAPPPAAKAPSGGVSDAEDKTLRSEGFKKEVHNGETFYCHRETPIGTRFEQKVCRSGDQIMADQREAKDELQQAQHGSQGLKNN
jgi:hypothetical protein